MDDEKIKELAERYVKEEHYDDFFLNEATRVIQWLSQTHCIVEKEKVNDFWHEITTLYLNGGKITYDGARFMFQSLFGKELFNGEK